jgi:hypothetical protein
MTGQIGRYRYRFRSASVHPDNDHSLHSLLRVDLYAHALFFAG